MLHVIDLVKAARKLKGRSAFQGTQISVENRKGSYRPGAQMKQRVGGSHGPNASSDADGLNKSLVDLLFVVFLRT